MTLRLKINLIVGALTVLFSIAVLALQFRSLRESVHEEVVAANLVASQLLNRTAWRYAAQGTPAMLAFLQGMGRVRSNDITFVDAAGHELYRSPPSPYKAGRDAPRWFEALIAPAPSVQAIDFPDGRLVVRSNASRANIDAWDYVCWLALGVALLLLAVNALVFWLVGRAVRPLGQIAAALDTLQTGRFDVMLPPLSGTEAAAIGTAFNGMVGMLQTHLDTERRAVLAERRLSDSRELSRWIDQHIEQERRLIARELHDEFGQSVTAMRSMALSIAQRVRGLDAQAEQAARLIADESSRLYDAMHGIIPRLTPLVLDHFGLAEALGDLVERTRRSQPGVEIELAVDLGTAQIDADAALALYRTAQEGMTNALRHGAARRVDVRLDGSAGRLRLGVTDDGTGLPDDALQRPGHHGLRWLAERVASLGGRFEIERVAPRGTRLRVDVPAAAAALPPSAPAHRAGPATPSPSPLPAAEPASAIGIR